MTKLRLVVIICVVSVVAVGLAARSANEPPPPQQSPKQQATPIVLQADPAPSLPTPDGVPAIDAHAPDPVAEFQARAAAAQAQRPARPDSPLEREIAELERQLVSTSAHPAPAPRWLKERLNELYAQRPENQIRMPDNLDQGGENCTGYAWISGTPVSDSGSTFNAVNDFQGVNACTELPNSAPDVIYIYVPTFTGVHTISTCGSSYDTAIEIRTGGACPGTTQVGCNDDACGLQSMMTVTLTAGVVYYLIIDGFYQARGGYVLQITDACDYSCGAADLVECAETPGPDFGATDCNGGCNLAQEWGQPMQFQDIFPDQFVCGRTFSYLNTEAGYEWRDVDWYRFTINQTSHVRLSAYAEFPLQLMLMRDCGPSGAVGWVFAPACQYAEVFAADLPPGDYYMFVGPTIESGLNPPRDYTALMTYYPAGCSISRTILAPAIYLGNTCGMENTCDWRASEDETIRINIPYDGEWTIANCSGDPVWDSYLFLSEYCCEPALPLIDTNDDGCGGVGFSRLSCVYLTRGTYYATVEGYGSGDCGPNRLSVLPCIGRCCYGDLSSPSCADNQTRSQCAALGGVFSEGNLCASSPCPPRPGCAGGSLFFQAPHVPSEDWGATLSESSPPTAYEHFSGVTAPIETIRFWGFTLDPVSYGPCVEDPFDVQVNFYADAAGALGPLVCQYTASVAPVPGASYPSGNLLYPLNGYTVVLDPPCALESGYVSVVHTGTACRFAWISAVQGDGWSYSIPNIGGDLDTLSIDLAFCLSGPCPPIDSVVIRLTDDGESFYSSLNFVAPAADRYNVYAAATPNPPPGGAALILSYVFPAGPATLVLPGFAQPSQFYWVTRDCGSAGSAARAPVRRLE